MAICVGCIRSTVGSDDGATSAWVIDLVLPAVRLAVEVDGPSHRKTAQKAIDRAKEEFLMSRAFRAIRVSNEQVLNDLEAVVAFITRVASRPAAVQTARPF